MFVCEILGGQLSVTNYVSYVHINQHSQAFLMRFMLEKYSADIRKTIRSSLTFHLFFLTDYGEY